MDKCQIGKYNLIDEFQKTNVCLMFEAYKKDRLLLDIIPLEVLKETSELMSMSELIDKGNGRNWNLTRKISENMSLVNTLLVLNCAARWQWFHQYAKCVN